jgi:hypothetical protein
MRFLLGRCVVVVTLACWAVPTLAQQDKVGVVTEITAKATAQAPDRPIEKLVIGHKLIRKERISTFDKGQVQLLLTDQSTLTLAENSEIVIDDIVFDPKTGTSQITATISKGLVRYGGQMNKRANAQFLTPSGTVDIRGGGAALITVEPKSPAGSSQ